MASKAPPPPKPPKIPTLKTERLWLRPLALTDAERVQKLFPQWEIVKHLARQVPWPYPANGALLYYRNIALPAIARGEQWHWTLRLKSRPGQLIGAIALFRDGDNNRGFWLAPEWQGKGLMTEAVEAVNAFWFDVLGMTTLRAPKAVANVGSRRISEKTGMRLVEMKESDYVSGRLPTEVWEITAEEWRAWKKTQRR
jgi:ribosomal-protein-alanine N-acetyltransferase